MIEKGFANGRDIKATTLSADLTIVGGGMAGVCCAITAARAGITVVLLQDRPVLGGNSSSEVRLWILGATSHMGNNNRWAREGGVIDEILVENMYRNREGNPVIFDTILLEKVVQEENITLLLNTTVYQTTKESATRISSVTGFCSQNSTRYEVRSTLFCDASGDGIVAFQSGASFRMGAESRDEFGEKFAPNIEDYGELLGHSLYFHTKDVGQPVKFVAPSYALKDVNKLARWSSYQLKDDGCRLWWVEYGGRLDTIHQSEDIKWELWRVVYGIWDHVKNSGEYPEAENLTLEWVGTIPGKRESRRFMGDYILVQDDIIHQKQHYDAVAVGGWSIDLHPADGVYSDKRPCNQWHAKGTYQIPYRCYYSKDLENLFLAGRIISASHVAFASTRVMATCAHGGQAVGMAAALAIHQSCVASDLALPGKIGLLQQALHRSGQGIPQVHPVVKNNLMTEAHVTSDAELNLHEIPFDGDWTTLEYSSAQMLPLAADQNYRFQVLVKAKRPTVLKVELRTSEKVHNYTPEICLAKREYILIGGEQEIIIDFNTSVHQDQYVYVCFMENPEVKLKNSLARISGLLSVFNKTNKAVSNFGKQDPPEDIGVETFEFWVPIRRPEGQNIAMKIEPPITCFAAHNIANNIMRPEVKPNAFVAPLESTTSILDIYWSERKTIREIIIFMDTDYDHPMESTLLGHPEDVIPFCVRDYSLMNCGKTMIFSMKGNHQTQNRIVLDEPIESDHLQLTLHRSLPNVPISLFEVMCF